MNFSPSAKLTSLVLSTMLFFVAAGARADEEQDLIARLQSGANVTDKCAACQRLRVIGTAKSVPALAALLPEERTGHAARHALEAMPSAEAGGALREAFGKTLGVARLGIIDSLGWRRDLAALPLLTPLLGSADTSIASAAAAALGRIGGERAVQALAAARDKAPPAVQAVVLESLLQCAERFLTDGNASAAAAIYRELFAAKTSSHVRAAAWRGLALSDARERTKLLISALAASDETHAAALKLVRELSDADAVRACVAQWDSLPADAQVAVLDAYVKLGAESLPLVRRGSMSKAITVRVAALQALGELGDTECFVVLSEAAARGETAERDAARQSLARVRGPGIREAFLARLKEAGTPEKAELLQALGERDDRAAGAVLLQHAASADEVVRVASLESLRRLALPESIAPLLELAAKSTSDAQRDPVLKALYAVCQASADKAEAARQLIASMNRFSAAERRQVLPLLAELATPDALAAAQSATREQDGELAREAVRVLGQWPNAAPASQLLELARTGATVTLRTLALRGAIEVTGQEPDAGKRLALLQQAMASAQRIDEKKQVLGQVGQIPSREALDFVLPELTNAQLANEAALATVSIAEKLAPSNAVLADAAASRVLAQVQDGPVAKRAWALRIKPGSGASFIRDWVVCGPYRQDRAGAETLFNIPFGPEKAGEKVEWKSVPRADHVSLLGVFPNEGSCVAYLRSEIIAPAEVTGALLMGSDDGIKAWLNGTVVHANNIDRGEAADQDTAPIKLKKGTNDLLLKITQGGGGWSASARLVGADGKPIPGLLTQRPAGTALPATLRR